MSAVPPEADIPAIGRFAPEAAIRKSIGITMSAFHPEADIAQLRSHVSFVPRADLLPWRLSQPKSVGELGYRRCYIFSPRVRTRVSHRSIEHDDYLVRIRLETSICSPRQLAGLN